MSLATSLPGYSGALAQSARRSARQRLQRCSGRNALTVRAAAGERSRYPGAYHGHWATQGAPSRRHAPAGLGCPEITLPRSGLGGESQEEILERRQRESATVEERSHEISSRQELARFLDDNGDKLTVVEFYSDLECGSGLEEEAELQWRISKEEEFAPCVSLKHTMQRCARDCPDVSFASVMADGKENETLCKELNLNTFPTLQFYRGRRLLHQIVGTQGAERNLGEGVLFFGDGIKGKEVVVEITNQDDLDRWLQAEPKDCQMSVLNVSVQGSQACLQIFPAVLALAKSMHGARFARLVADTDQQTRALAEALNVDLAPTFLFFHKGELKKRFIGGSRGDLIGQILDQLGALNPVRDF